MSYYSHQGLKSGLYVHIAVISVVFGITVVGISSALLTKIKDEKIITYSSGSNDESPEILGSNTLVLIISIGIVATLLQLVASIALWCTKERESKPLVLGFIGGQILIQIILITCMALAFAKHSKTPNPHLLQASPSTSTSHGHAFSIILACNVIFHFGAITYLIILVMKHSNNDDTEEMTAVVIHRKIQSRIPKTQRHGVK